MKTSFLSLPITPPIGVPLAGNAREDSHSRGIHDALYANYAYVEIVNKKHLFISIDLIGIKKRDADDIKSRITQNCGLLAENITITATHTHSGPNTVNIFKTFLSAEDISACKVYRAWLVDSIAAATPRVIAAAMESKIGRSCDTVEGYSFNRRVILNDGSLRMVFEEYDHSQIERLAGPNGDTKMHVFVFVNMQEQVQGIIIQYTSHPAVVCGEDWFYTRDYIHMLTEKLKQHYGQNIVVLYMNGAQGNQVAADPYKPFVTGFAEAERVGEGLAEGAIRMIDRVLADRALDDYAPFASRTASLTLPIRKISQEEVNRAKDILRLCDGSAQLHGLDPRVEAESILEMADLNEDQYDTIIQAIRIGDVLILTFPGEVFLELAHNALRDAPFRDAMIFGLANDYIGYIPTKEAFGEGGYEIKTSYVSSRFDPCAGDVLVEASRKLIRSLIKEQT